MKQLLDISFEVALGQMKETQEPFDLAGLVVLRTNLKVVKERKDAKINTNTGRHSVAAYEPQIRVIPLKKLQGMVRLEELHGFRSGEVSA